MSQGWDKYEPAPIEYMHSLFIDEITKLRIEKGVEPKDATFTSSEVFQTFVRCKKATYAYYEGAGIDKPILKVDMPK